jgi:Uncharacterized protein conserved in bacteria
MKKILVVILTIVVVMGVYGATKEGKGSGYNGEIKVSIETDGDKIIEINVVQNSDDKRIGEPAIKKLTEEIIEKQSTNVDTIAGAIYTSNGFIEAVSDALK